VSEVLLAIPNISEGSNLGLVESVAAAYRSEGAIVLDQSSVLAKAIVAGWRVAASGIDLNQQTGVHPHVGALDVAPFVYLDGDRRGAASAAALTVAGDLGRSGASVFLYGALGGGRTRAELRAGGIGGLRERVAAGLVSSDFGPSVPSEKEGAVLVAARPPLVAFNLQLGSASSLEEARDTAALMRDGGDMGLPGVKALAFDLKGQGIIQLSFNLERPDEAGIDAVTHLVSTRHQVVAGELIGLAPERYIAAIPSDLEMPDFDPTMKSVEGCLRFHGITT
jgi:glutamate formiminotransferase/glutamate formiminotransferase/formiminotetrahydrofolate cyclodeaminase